MPATELTLATRILAHLGALAEGGHVAMRVGSDVVYAGARLVAPQVMTPYDVAAVRLRDGLVLAGDPPADLDRYLLALRSDASAMAVAALKDGSLATGSALSPLVERVTGLQWGAALERARALGGLVGAYPAEAG